LLAPPTCQSGIEITPFWVVIRPSGMRQCSWLKRGAAWLIWLPLAVASWLGAHCFAYWLVSPGAEQHMGLHAERGHAYLGYTPAILIWGLALALAGLVLCVGEGLRGRRPSRPPLRLFALLPPVGFAVQEHLERLVATGGIPHDLWTEPTFLVGLALQLPFALAALLVAYGLHSLGFGVGRTLSRALAVQRPVRCAPPSALSVPAPAALITTSVLAPGQGPRAPPAVGW
jgi:hypothetical protein